MDVPVAVVQSTLKEESIIKLLSLAGVKVQCEYNQKAQKNPHIKLINLMSYLPIFLDYV